MNPPDASPVPYANALAAVLAEAAPLGSETVPLAAAPGRILAQDLVADFDLPAFDNTAVDGYAVHAADLERANRDGTAEVALGPVIPAGQSARGHRLQPGLAARVLTGSPLPADTAAVVMQEDVVVSAGRLRLAAKIFPGQFIRRQGEEFRRGAVAVTAGRRLTPPLCALAATLGCAQLEVARQPSVGVLVTGSELVPPGQPRRDGQIYDSNGPGLAAALARAGVKSVEVRSAPDALEPTRAALAALLEAHDIVITSGGVSVGTYDAVKDALRLLGVEQRFWRVAIKPGKPFFFGVHPQGGRRAVVFGLPGNPLSALVTFTVFAWPYLRAVQGDRESARTVPAHLSAPLRKPAGRLEFVPVGLSAERDGWSAQPLDKRASHMLGGLAVATALAVFPAELERLEAGAEVACVPLPWN